jgi:hypothetical protein
MFGNSPLEIMAMQAMLQRLVYCYHFNYSALFFGATALGASATVTVPTQITADSDFVIQRMNLVSYTALDTPEGNPDYTLLLTVAGNAVNLMDQPQHVNNICGNFFDNRVPNDIPFPVLIPANNTLTSQLVNRSAVAANYVLITYTGFKVKYLAHPDGTPTSRQEVFHVL